MSVWVKLGFELRGYKREMGSVRVGLGKAAEEGRIPSVKHSNRVPKPQIGSQSPKSGPLAWNRGGCPLPPKLVVISK